MPLPAWHIRIESTVFGKNHAQMRKPKSGKGPIAPWRVVVAMKNIDPMPLTVPGNCGRKAPIKAVATFDQGYNKGVANGSFANYSDFIKANCGGTKAVGGVPHHFI